MLGWLQLGPGPSQYLVERSGTRDQGPAGFGIFPQGLRDGAVPPGLWVGFSLTLMFHFFDVIGGLLKNEAEV